MLAADLAARLGGDAIEEAMEEQTTILIADDHSVFRMELKDLIARNPAYLLIGEAPDGDLAWKGISAAKPEIALLDIDMPGMTGLELAARIQKSLLEVNVILVTSYKEESLFNQAMDLGVRGYVVKDDYVADLPEALRVVRDGNTYLSPSIRSFACRCGNRSSGSKGVVAGLDELTPTELRVLRLIADDIGFREIGKRLGIGIAEVESHRDRIGAKIGLCEHREIVTFARRSRAELVGFKLFPEDAE